MWLLGCASRDSAKSVATSCFRPMTSFHWRKTISPVYHRLALSHLWKLVLIYFHGHCMVDSRPMNPLHSNEFHTSA